MGLWAKIEAAIYKEGLTGKKDAEAEDSLPTKAEEPAPSRASNGVPSRQNTDTPNEHGGADGYQQEFIANIER